MTSCNYADIWMDLVQIYVSNNHSSIVTKLEEAFESCNNESTLQKKINTTIGNIQVLD